MKEILSTLGNAQICPVGLFVDDKKILLGFRHYTAGKWKSISVWTVPGGRCEEGELVEDTLRREVSEEIGITDFKILNYLGEIPGAKEGDRVLLFSCATTQVPRLMEPNKFSEWRWFGVKEIPENIINPLAIPVIIDLLQ